MTLVVISFLSVVLILLQVMIIDRWFAKIGSHVDDCRPASLPIPDSHVCELGEDDIPTDIIED